VAPPIEIGCRDDGAGGCDCIWTCVPILPIAVVPETSEALL
jgi:hypothetical protein